MTPLILMSIACANEAKQIKPINNVISNAKADLTRPSLGYNANQPTRCTMEISLPSDEKVELQVWGIDKQSTIYLGQSLAKVFWVSWIRNELLLFRLLKKDALTALWKDNQYQQTKHYASGHVKTLSCDNTEPVPTGSVWTTTWNNGPTARSTQPGIAIELARRQACLSNYAVDMTTKLREIQTSPQTTRDLRSELTDSWNKMIQCHLQDSPKPQLEVETVDIETGPFQCQTLAVDNGKPKALGLQWGHSHAQTALLSLTQTAWQSLYSEGLTAPNIDAKNKKVIQWAITGMSGMTSNEAHCGKMSSIPKQGEWTSKRKASLQHCHPYQRTWNAEKSQETPSKVMQKYCMDEARVIGKKKRESARKINDESLEVAALFLAAIRSDGCASDCLNSEPKDNLIPVFLPGQPIRKTQQATFDLFWAALEAKETSKLSKLLPNNSLFPLNANMHKSSLTSLLSPQFNSRIKGMGKKEFESDFMDTFIVNGHHLLRFNTRSD